VPDAPSFTVPPALLRAFPPSADALLDLARAGMDDGMLLEMAQADYGVQADEHLAALRVIRDTGAVPAPIEWVPQEVLELIRWSEPDDPSWKPGSTGERGHRMRAFACAALLRAAGEPANALHLYGSAETLAQMVGSALVLGPAWQEALAGLLTWRIPSHPVDEDRPYHAFALLFLAVLLRDGRLDGNALAAAAEWVIEEEAAAAGVVFAGYPPTPGPWLIRLGPNLRDSVFRSLARRMLDEAPALPPPARDPIQLIAQALLEG
jgi:hypothetical protein